MHEYGDASVLRIDDVDVQAPAADEVQIKVKAIGINRAEVMFRNHAYLQDARFPSRLGYEASGVIELLGASVKGFAIGDVVSVVPSQDITNGGTYGELVNVQSRLVVKHPENLSFEDGAAVWMAYVTAWGGLIEQAKLSHGEAVIISAASSSVGIAAFQIAKIVGATVIATTRTSAKRQALLDAGADYVVATEEEDLVTRVLEITNGIGARVVFDPVGGPSFLPLTAAMARGGILLEYGVLSVEPTPFPLLTVLSKCLTLKGYLYTEVVSDDAVLERAKTFITDGLVSGALKPLIARTFAFDDIQDAHRFLESNEQIGKVIVTL
jgi:NADPH:quinone reductase-like Zn-dependent oxidoreductase